MFYKFQFLVFRLENFVLNSVCSWLFAGKLKSGHGIKSNQKHFSGDQGKVTK